MNPHDAMIDAVVAEVLRRLRPTAPAGDAVRLTERVVSVASLAGKLAGARTVIIPRGAVITPAARDLLRAQKIAVASATDEPTPTSAARVLLGLAETEFDPTSLVTALRRESIVVELLARTGWQTVARELAHEAALGGARGALLTSRDWEATCVANRRPGVRACRVRSVGELHEAIAAMGANLMIVNPKQTNLAALKTMLRDLSRSRATGAAAVVDRE